MVLQSKVFGICSSLDHMTSSDTVPKMFPASTYLQILENPLSSNNLR